ncbi:MAG: GTPase HflX [Phycisphaeraceae bacterium]|nr:GTPase HflX [Phycisphaeraceae bacterium]
METGTQELNIQSERAVLVSVRVGREDEEVEDPLRELRSLAETAGVRVVGEMEQRIRTPRPATYIGKGKVEELAAMVKSLGAKVVIFDHDLSPGQVRNIEKELSAKVLDRSELILDIFANRATTAAARLQVEIAQLQYTAPRLRAMWQHLGQVTGGAPMGVGTRGPGEQQLEIDRRLVKSRLDRLRTELAQVQARKSREVMARRAEHFTIGLVGYTNAGKSSLFNALTRGGAFAHSKLFATLGTRVEQWNLGGGNIAMLSDTVGFIRRLPHHLVASFRSTLEDAVHAHLLLLVVDVSDPEAELQMATVREVLDEIGATSQPRLLVLNKVDRLANPEASVADGASLDADGRPRLGVSEHRRRARELAERLERWLEAEPEAIAVSAHSGEGLEALRIRALEFMRGEVAERVIELETSQSRAIDFIERRTEVLDRTYVDGRVQLRVRIGRRQLEQLMASGAPFLVDGVDLRSQAEGGFSRSKRRERLHERHVSPEGDSAE